MPEAVQSDRADMLTRDFLEFEHPGTALPPCDHAYGFDEAWLVVVHDGGARGLG